MANASIDEIENKLVDFFTGEINNLEEVIIVSSPYIYKIIKSKSYNLPKDLFEDVFQEVCLKLLSLQTNTFDKTRGTGKQFLYGLILNAIQKVRRAYGLSYSRKPENEVISLDDKDANIQLESSYGKQQIENEIEARNLLSKADKQLRLCLFLIYFKSLAKDVAATKLGWSRFQLQRRLNTFRLKFSNS